MRFWPPSRSFTGQCLLHSAVAASWTQSSQVQSIGVVSRCPAGLSGAFLRGGFPAPPRARENSAFAGGCAAHCCRHLSFPGVSGLAWAWHQLPTSGARVALSVHSSVFSVGTRKQVRPSQEGTFPNSQWLPPRCGWAGALVPVVHTVGAQAAGQATVCSPAGHHTSTVHHARTPEASPEVACVPHTRGQIKSTAVPKSRGGGAGPPQAGDGGAGLGQGLPAPAALTSGTPDATWPQAPLAEPTQSIRARLLRIGHRVPGPPQEEAVGTRSSVDPSGLPS